MVSAPHTGATKDAELKALGGVEGRRTYRWTEVAELVGGAEVEAFYPPMQAERDARPGEQRDARAGAADGVVACSAADTAGAKARAGLERQRFEESMGGLEHQIVGHRIFGGLPKEALGAEHVAQAHPIEQGSLQGGLGVDQDPHQPIRNWRDLGGGIDRASRVGVPLAAADQPQAQLLLEEPGPLGQLGRQRCQPTGGEPAPSQGNLLCFADRRRYIEPVARVSSDSSVVARDRMVPARDERKASS